MEIGEVKSAMSDLLDISEENLLVTISQHEPVGSDITVHYVVDIRVKTINEEGNDEPESVP